LKTEFSLLTLNGAMPVPAAIITTGVAELKGSLKAG
jgi:hypothetical protein